MAEYIKREAAIRVVNGKNSLTMTRSGLINSINSIPAADVAPVVHGRWIQKKEWHLGRWVAWFECSECGEHDDNSDMYEIMPFCNLSNYCPGCGAKMDGGDK